MSTLEPVADLQPAMAEEPPVLAPPAGPIPEGETVNEDGKPSTPTLVVPKPSRIVPKVFASPKKKQEQSPPAPVLVRKESMRSRLRKALAPYLAASYWQGEAARKFTQEFIELNPPPEDEGALPAYIATHLRGLSQVTERWGGCVAKALDPMSHDLAVNGRLQRQRDREEGRIPEEELPGGVLDLEGRQVPADPDDYRLGGSSYEYFALQQQPPSPGGAGAGAEAAVDRLTADQLEGAVHLVADIKVWKEILAARQAEERRQHAIAELHLHHAARIIQRSWRTFVRRRREEKARLDALVSPDVQAMLSAAAYKAMRDARNRLQLTKLRRSLSRRAKGFGSTAPRDIVPAPSGLSRKNLHSQPHPPAPAPGSMGRRSTDTASHGSRTTRPSMESNGPAQSAEAAANSAAAAGQGEASRAGTGEGADGGDDAAGAAEGAGANEGGAPGVGSVGFRASGLGAVKSFVTRSAKLLKRLVSFKDAEAEADSEAEADAEAAKEDGDEGEGGNAAAAEAAGPAEGRYAAVEESYFEGGESGDEEYGGEDEAEEGDEEHDSLEALAEEGDGAEEEEDPLNDAESAEAAMAEAEVVVQVAAELAEAILGLTGVGEAEEEGEGEEAASIDAAAAEAGLAEAAADAVAAALAEGAPGEGEAEADADAAAPDAAAGAAAAADGTGVSSVLAPPPLKAAAAARTAKPSPPSRGTAVGGGGRVVQARRGAGRLSEESAVMRQVIAGALAAAAAPVLGRNGAMAVAQLGLGGAPLQGRGRGGGSPRAAAARLRPTNAGPASPSASQRSPSAAPAAPAAGAFSHASLPLEIRAAAAVAAGLSPSQAGEGAGAPAAAPPPPSTPTAEGSDLSLPALDRVGSASVSGPLQPRVSGYGPGPGGSTSGGLLDAERSSPSMPPAQPAWQARIVDGGAGGVSSAAHRERRASASGLPAVPAALPAVVGVPPPSLGAAAGGADASPDASPTTFAPRQPRASLPAGLGGASSSASPSPHASPDGVGAAAYAGAGQPWAAPRHRVHHFPPHAPPHPPPPGSTTLSGSLPDPRGHGREPASPALRDPSWMLPPITAGINRSVTGLAGLAPGGAGGAAAHGHAAGGNGHSAIAAMLRTASDPALQRPANLAATTGGTGSGGGGGPSGGLRHGLGALTAAATAGRMRRSSLLGSSVDGPLLSTGPLGQGGGGGGGGGNVSPVRRQPRGSNVSPGRLAVAVEVKSATGAAASFTAGAPGMQVGLLINGVQRDSAATLGRTRGANAPAGLCANEPASPGLGSYIMLGGPGGPTPVRPHAGAGAGAGGHGTIHTGLSPSVPRASQQRS